MKKEFYILLIIFSMIRCPIFSATSCNHFLPPEEWFMLPFQDQLNFIEHWEEKTALEQAHFRLFCLKTKDLQAFPELIKANNFDQKSAINQLKNIRARKISNKKIAQKILENINKILEYQEREQPTLYGYQLIGNIKMLHIAGSLPDLFSDELIKKTHNVKQKTTGKQIKLIKKVCSEITQYQKKNLWTLTQLFAFQETTQTQIPANYSPQQFLRAQVIEQETLKELKNQIQQHHTNPTEETAFYFATTLPTLLIKENILGENRQIMLEQELDSLKALLQDAAKIAHLDMLYDDLFHLLVSSKILATLSPNLHTIENKERSILIHLLSWLIIKSTKQETLVAILNKPLHYNIRSPFKKAVYEILFKNGATGNQIKQYVLFLAQFYYPKAFPKTPMPKSFDLTYLESPPKPAKQPPIQRAATNKFTAEQSAQIATILQELETIEQELSDLTSELEKRQIFNNRFKDVLKTPQLMRLLIQNKDNSKAIKTLAEKRYPALKKIFFEPNKNTTTIPEFLEQNQSLRTETLITTEIETKKATQNQLWNDLKDFLAKNATAILPAKLIAEMPQQLSAQYLKTIKLKLKEAIKTNDQPKPFSATPPKKAAKKSTAISPEVKISLAVGGITLVGLSWYFFKQNKKIFPDQTTSLKPCTNNRCSADTLPDIVKK